MWRLMYAMLVVSNGGSVAVDSHHTDWPSEASCHHAARTLYTTPEKATINGVHLTIKMNVQCVPVDGHEMPPQVGYSYGPPPPPPPPFVGGFPGITFGPRGVRIGPRY